MLKNTLIIALLLLVIYLYYQQRQNNLATFTGSDTPEEMGERSPLDLQSKYNEVKKVNQIMAKFCREEIGGQDINEIRARLNGRKLVEILEERQSLAEALSKAEERSEDYETTVDELKRKKGELEMEITSLTNTWKNRVSEKERIITRVSEEKKDLETKYKKKAKQLDEEQLENNKLTQQITKLEEQIKDLEKQYGLD